MNESTMLDRVIETEKFVLSAMLIREGECVPAVMSALEPDDFYRPQHKLVYRTMLKVYAANSGKVDALLVLNELQTTGNIENVGFTFVASLTEYANTNATIDSHVNFLKEQSNLRRLQFTAEKIAQEVQKGITPANQLVATLQNDINAITGAAGKSKISTFGDFFNHKIIPALDESSKYGERKTGFDNIDEEQIFSPGLYILGAVPACGKTTFAWQLLEQLARNGESCIYCSYEMSALELYTKSVARELLNRNPDKDPLTLPTAAFIRRHKAKDLPLEVINVMGDFAGDKLPLKVLELQNENVDELLTLLRPLCTDVEKAPVVCIDYLQIIPFDKDTAKLGVDDVVRKLKKFQSDTNTTFIVVSSFNRMNYTQTVSYESFKESGAIEYTADVIWGLQLAIMEKLKNKESSVIRQEADKAKKEVPREVQLKCLKNRQGANYECYFKYFAANDCFVPCAESDFDSATTSGKGRKSASSTSAPPPVDDSYSFEEDENHSVNFKS